MKKFKNKFRAQTIRLQTWDYSKKAKYHITICTHQMNYYFGKVEHEEMIYSAEGKIALDNLMDLPNKFPNLKLDEFQIMPNHIHAIVIIETRKTIKDSTLKDDTLKESSDPISEIENSKWNSGHDIPSQCEGTTKCIPSIQQINDLSNFEKAIEYSGGITGSNNPMLHEGLSSAMRFFKGKTTFEIHKINKSFKWHPRFYDVIIRNDKHLECTRKYIQNNVKNWGR